MKAIRNMRELTLMKQKLEYQEQLYEKEMVASTADIIENLSDKLRDLAFDLGTRIVVQLITSRRKQKRHAQENEAS